jgi:hypothetical protein
MFGVLLAVGALIAAVAVAIMAEGRLVAALVMIAVYLLGAAMFYAATIEVTGQAIKFWFGIGIVRTTIPLSEVQDAKEIENPWYYFWGVKSIPGGWWWAIAPGPGVELTLKNGRLVQLGSNQPQQLCQAIEAARSRTGQPVL